MDPDWRTDLVESGDSLKAAGGLLLLPSVRRRNVVDIGHTHEYCTSVCGSLPAAAVNTLRAYRVEVCAVHEQGVT
jgi:hypothetical protein